ncbi:MAG: DUF4339 domain-containing protein [Prevotella sp.]|nr:DUF4339 domain-containing protein [Prevotella sp.]MCM1075453.1 DUF4339 domain-containing protein [Ruminococcus sp.]
MKYYIKYKDEQFGPLEIPEMAEKYGLNPKSRVWKTGTPAWVNAEQIPEIMAFLNSNGSVVVPVDDDTANQGITVTIPIDKDKFKGFLSNPYTFPILAVVLAFATCIVTFAKSSIIDGGEMLLILSLYVLAPLLTAIAGIICAKNFFSPLNADNPVKKSELSGLAVGLGIGASVCSVISLVIACCGFDLL